MKLSQFGRLLQINHVLGRHRLDELILAIHFPAISFPELVFTLSLAS